MNSKIIYILYCLFYIPILMCLWILSPLLVCFNAPSYGYINNGTSFGTEPRLINQLSWAMTPDNSLWGDDGWKKNNPNYKSYWSMVRWLYRNPAYGLTTSLLSMPVTASGLWQKRLECKFGWQTENPQNGRIMFLLSIRFKDVE